MLGNIVNAAAIIVGGVIGATFHRALPQRFQAIIFQGTGLFVTVLGISMAIKMEHVLISVFSLILGGLAGELLRIDKQINAFGDWLKRRLKFKSERFTNGFVSASLLYCTGAMAVLGAIEEGLGNFPTILLTKSTMDGFISIVLAATSGIGVAFSASSVAIYQGSITLAAYLFASSVDMAIVNELSAVGGILLAGLGMNMLEIKKFEIVNLLPALVFVVALMVLMSFV